MTDVSGQPVSPTFRLLYPWRWDWKAVLTATYTM